MNSPAKLTTRLAQLFAARLCRWRAERAIPQKQLAADLGVSISVVSAWERGSRFPSAQHLEAIARYTSIPVCQLLYPGPEGCSGKRSSFGSPAS